MPNAVRFVATLVFTAVIAAAAGPVIAAGSTSSSKPAAERPTDFAVAEKAVKAGQYRKAINLLETVVAKSPRNADAFNYLGFSHRKLGQFEPALAWYQKALAVNPDHRGANEYLGELYLQMGDLEKAKQRLARLDDICFFGCEEYDDLKKAVAAYKPKS